MENKLIDMIDKLQLVAVQITDKLIEVTPKAFDVICWIKRIDSIGNLMFSLLGIGIFYIGCKIYKKIKESAKSIECRWDKSDRISQANIFLGISSLIGLIGVIGLLNVWAWVGVFKPELAIAKDVYDSVLEKTEAKK